MQYKILEEIHPYKIYDNSKTVKGQWATYVPDPTKPSRRRLIRRNCLEDLRNAIIRYYKIWKTHIKDTFIDDIQMNKYLVSDISAKLLYRFFRKITKDREYTKKAICNIKGVLSVMLTYAVELGILDHNPARDIDTKKLIYKPVPPKQDDVYTFHDAQLLLRYLEDLDDPYALAIRLDFNINVIRHILKFLHYCCFCFTHFHSSRTDPNPSSP